MSDRTDPEDDGIDVWPPPKSLNDIDMLAFASGQHLSATDAEGNPVTFRPIYPIHESSLTEEGWTARNIYEDHVVELVWNAEEGHWDEPEDPVEPE